MQKTKSVRARSDVFFLNVPGLRLVESEDTEPTDIENEQNT